ncbi:hypothetical protein O181_097242 [Austropuccinia psidii MF-1]|uniref:Uncharacterized protein n=1 Tax=Austropuccinia psidii MF-1 TaxID=1389203 RepID=A0A9Q3PEB5_9BASI|nr:hypothetical protein [Austropuccinia psidii MF-1]
MGRGHSRQPFGLFPRQDIHPPTIIAEGGGYKKIGNKKQQCQVIKTGTTPEIHKQPTNRIVPEILSEYTTLCTSTYPLLTSRLSIVICNIRMEELESAKNIQKGEIGHMWDAKCKAPDRWMDAPISIKTLSDALCLTKCT